MFGLQLAVTNPEATAAACLPDGAGFLTMRLRGSIEAEVEWRGTALDCAGMTRPDGNGVRLRFAGLLPGAGELAVVFAAPQLRIGTSAHDVPVNVTLLDRHGQRIYGTRGDQRCRLDSVLQEALAGAEAPSRSFRVTARGFCTEPARALDGGGAILLTRFDFAGIVTISDDEAAGNPERQP